MEREPPHVELLNEHAEIEALLQELVAAYDTGERAIATPAFKAVDRRLAEHFAHEERFLLPSLVELDPEGAAAIRAEHATIRAACEKLGILDELHASRATQVRELVELLRRHAQREETTLYRLADRLGGGRLSA